MTGTIFSILVTIVLSAIIGMFIVKAIKKDLDNVMGLVCGIIAVVVGIGGLIIIPMVSLAKTEKIEITNHLIIKNSVAVVLDLTNSPEYESIYNILVKFDTYKAVTEIGDSTKYFILRKKSFYGIEINKEVVWSNPPYDLVFFN